MTRKAAFAVLRPFAPKGGIPASDVPILDALFDRWGLDRDGAKTGERRTSQRGIGLIHEFETLHRVLPDGRIASYPDPGPTGLPWTIGWGSTGPDIGRDTIWTRQQADDRFAADLAKFEAEVNAMLGSTTTTQAQFDALVSLAYNVGPANVRGSTLLKKHRAGDHAGAQAEFARWNRAGGKVLAGLTRRRAAEARLYGVAS